MSGFHLVAFPFPCLCLGRHAQRHQKPCHHVVGRNRSGQLDNLAGVKVLFDLREHVVGDFDVQHRQKAGRTRH